MGDTTTDQVRQQYSAFRYPAAIMDIPAAIESGYFLYSDPAKFSALIWPEGRPSDALRILVAGCGTNEAAVIAHNNPSCSVLGVDLSRASLDHEEFLQRRYGLTNLVLEQRDLRDLRGRGPFDYIICGGVLHHMPDPGAGLRALAAELARSGSIFLMLYGRPARVGVYLMQDIFRRLGIRQDQAGLAFVKDTLSSLPDTHYVKHFISGSSRSEDDAEVVDTYLHPQDRAYDVAEVLAFVRDHGLCFQTWVDNGKYCADNLKAGSPLEQATRELPLEQQWSIVEAVTLLIPKHIFLACGPQRPASGYTISFADDGWLDYVPVRHPKSGVRRNPPPDATVVEVTREQVVFSLSRGAAALFFAADGKRTIRAILDDAMFASIPADQRMENARRFFARMREAGHMFFTRGAA